MSIPLLSHYIEFPALGWHWPINDELVHFQLFGHPFTIKWYGVCIALGFMLAVIYGLSRAKELKLNQDKMIDAILVCTLLGFVGARLYYVFFCAEVSEYLANPISILYIWEGGIGIYGGIIAAFLSGLLMCKVCKLDTLTMFDLAALGFLIGQGIGRWGNFFNQEAFGGNTTLPWGMTGDIIAAGTNSGYDTALPVHPTFLYESLWCLLGFLLLHILSKKAYRFRGEIFCGYLVWYGTGRFFIESLRTDSLMIGTIKTSQLVAVLAVVGGVIAFFLLRNRARALPKTLLPADAAEDGTLDEPVEETAEDGTIVEPAEEAIEEETEDEIPEQDPTPEETAQAAQTEIQDIQEEKEPWQN